MSLAGALTSLCVLWMQTESAYPRQLEAVVAQAPWRTSQLEWTVTWVGGNDEGLVERYVTRTAGDTVWESNQGDENGFHPARFRNAPPGEYDENKRAYAIPRDELAGTQNTLRAEGQLWRLEYAEKPHTGLLTPDTERRAYTPVDVKGMGLMPAFDGALAGRTPIALPYVAADAFDSAVFATRTEGVRSVVEATFGEYRLAWDFDDAQGGQPVRAQLYRNDALQYYSESEYGSVNGRWIPTSVRFYRGDDKTPYKIVAVQRATFDEPSHLQEITPSDIGALRGTMFTTPTGAMVWTGVDLVDQDEYANMDGVYGILPDSCLLEDAAKRLGMSVDEYVQLQGRQRDLFREVYAKNHGERPWLEVEKKRKKEKDDWDVYVEKFLAEHKLPEPAIAKAREILDQAKSMRDARRRHHAARVREAKNENDQRKIQYYEKLEKRLFEGVLVRPLNKLLPDKRPEVARQPESGSP